MKYTIYLRTNKLNGKKYVGQTKDFKNRERHWRSLKEKYGNIIIRKDREEFGLDAFDVKILSEVRTREEAWELEKAFIKAFNTKYPNGYNMTFGGKDFEGRKLSEETKRKISESALSKQVYQYTLDGKLVKIWNSTKECGSNGYFQGNVSDCCLGKRKTHKGYKWSYNPL